MSVSLPPVHAQTSRRAGRRAPADESSQPSQSGSQTSRRSHRAGQPPPPSSAPLASLFQSTRRRSLWSAGSGDSGLGEDTEEQAEARQEAVRRRGRYSKATLAADFGAVFHSSDLGGDYSFNAETAEPTSGVHFHRGAPLTLNSLRPASLAQQPEQHHATFATEEDSSPRANLQIGSYGRSLPSTSSLLSGASAADHAGAVAETAGKTIWSMWKSMKDSRARAQHAERLRDVPTRSMTSSPFGGTSHSSHHAPSIDYVEAGKHIASQLSHAGVKVSHNHLDVIHNLAGMERVWLKTNEGLEKDEFVDFLREVLRLPAEELSILFQKMDANSDGSLSWDEYLSYLLIEVTHHWHHRSARGTWHLRDVDSPATPVHAQVQQILVIPRDANASAAAVNASGKYVFASRDNSIQVWNSSNLSYQCHLPPAWATPAKKLGSDESAFATMRHTSRISERKSGGRQKRVGGGGWKEDSIYSQRAPGGTSTQTSSTGGFNVAGKAQGAVDESISRRAAHAGIARLSMAVDRGADTAPNGMADDPEAVGYGYQDRGDDEREKNPFSRPRQGQGVLHTTVAYYPTQKQLLVATMDKSIHVYQQSFRQYIQIDRTEVLDTPQCMTVFLNQGGASSYQSSSQHMLHNSDLLIVGDTSGRCSAYTLPVSRDYGSSGGPNGDKAGNITTGGLKADSYTTSMGGVGVPGGMSSTQSNLLTSFSTAARPTYQYQVHRVGESVRKVAMIPNVGLVSAGMDAKLHISDLETERVIRSLEGHKRGVYSFAHCESHRCIISAGFDSRVLVFDPYLPNATGALASHHANILDVVVNEHRNQIITTCADKKIKVFDIRTFKCIQSLADSQEYTPYDELSAVTFDHEQQQLVTAGNKIRAWPVAIAPGNKARRGGPAHSNLVVAICYSEVFQQIISVSVDESVHLFDIYTGQCWAPGTLLQMFDGTLKAVEHIVPGDQLMGDDNTPRTVKPGSLIHRHTAIDATQQTASGDSSHPIPGMYEVKSASAGRTTFSCNGRHILVLKFQNHPTQVQHDAASREWSYSELVVQDGVFHEAAGYWAGGRIVIESRCFASQQLAEAAQLAAILSWQPLIWECSVDEFLACSPTVRDAAEMYQPELVQFSPPELSLRARLETALGTSITEQQTLDTAWAMGLWLTDATCSIEPVIVERLQAWHAGLSQLPLPSTEVRTPFSFEHAGHFMHAVLDSYGTLHNRSVPLDLQREAQQVRMAILAGAIDGGGDYDEKNQAFDLPAANAILLTDLTRLSRGLGFVVNSVGEKHISTSEHLIRITGPNLDLIPTELESKRAHPILLQDDLRSVRFTITPLGHGEYFGFTLDGNGRCLLEDFVVTHNSVFEFRTTHGSPLTAACLDHRGKRLITGAHDGSTLMWNPNNGARIFEFTSRKREVTALLYLPRTLQCVVGIGWERSVVRWPDPNAPKNTEWLVQSDHRAEVCSVAYFQTILVTGASDGEIISWHMDSARVNRRMEIPITPRTKKRPGVAKLMFVDFPSGLLLLLAGTDDGSLHFIKIGTSETVFSLFEIMNDPIIGMAANRVDPTHQGDHKFSGARTRLLIADCQMEAKLWDISSIVSEQITGVPLLKSWEPHPGGTTTDVIAIDAINSFILSSDTGEISVWTIDGDLRAKFAQRKVWPIADPRTGSRTVEEVEAERREAGAGTDSDASTESDTESGPLSGSSTRRGSVVSRAGSSKKKKKRVVTPPRKEPTFLEVHPMYVPRDENARRYLQEHAQQTLMEAAALAKERQAERERREEKSAAQNKLATMLDRLEVDLKNQQKAHAAHAYTGGHFYEKFHHATVSSQASTLGAVSDLTERVPRPPRMRVHHRVDNDRDIDASSPGVTSSSSAGRAGASPGHRDRANVSFAAGSRTISNSDVFSPPLRVNSTRKHTKH